MPLCGLTKMGHTYVWSSDLIGCRMVVAGDWGHWICNKTEHVARKSEPYTSIYYLLWIACSNWSELDVIEGNRPAFIYSLFGFLHTRMCVLIKSVYVSFCGENTHRDGNTLSCALKWQLAFRRHTSGRDHQCLHRWTCFIFSIAVERCVRAHRCVFVRAVCL